MLIFDRKENAAVVDYIKYIQILSLTPRLPFFTVHCIPLALFKALGQNVRAGMAHRQLRTKEQP